MNLDDLKDTWKQKHGELADGRVDELASRFVSRASRFERTILRRDLIETAAAIFVIVCFGWYAIESETLLGRAGAIVIILGAIEICIVLHWTRRYAGPSPHDLPLSEFCSAEIARVEQQIRLLRTVNWWYTGPLMLGCCLFVTGILWPLFELPIWIPAAFLTLMYAVFVGCTWTVYRINRRAVEQELVPLRDELATIYESLRNDSRANGESE